MPQLSKQLDKVFSSLSKDDPAARIQARATKVRAEFKEALSWVYRDNTQFFLDHVNAVYITKKKQDDEFNRLIVYVDESIYAADLNAQRETIKEVLNQKYKEDIDIFEVHISRGSYKKNYPYKEEKLLDGSELTSDKRKISLKKLSEDEEKSIENIAETIENTTVKESFKKAMTADLKRNI